MKNQKLRIELKEMFKKDQKRRFSGKWDFNIDKHNSERLKEIIERYGCPTFRLVGKEGSDAAWLIAQHADHDLRFQKKCLKLLKKAVENKQADKTCIAYLTDRVLVHEEKKQFYGTQFYTDNALVYGPRPIKDKKNLDKRRKSMGLGKFKDYEKKMHLNYKKWAFKQQSEKKIYKNISS